jgi:hypothetical protein
MIGWGFKMWPKDSEEFDGEMLFGYGPETELPEPKPAPEVSPEQQLLNFLQRWPKETVSLREIQQFAPRAVRTQGSVIDHSVGVLVRHGWLAPLQSHRRDRRAWQIARRPTVHPTVAQP